MKIRVVAMSLALLVLFGLFVFIQGCGQKTSGSSGNTNYSIQGKLASLTASSSGNQASATDTITHIAAAGSNGEVFFASLGSDGTFSIDINKGFPYALGFYNKTGSTITLLGYLKQDDVNWDSLPLMSPAGSSTDLGTVTVDSSSLEASTSVNLSSLIAGLNLGDTATAAYYGEIDTPMSVFTNVDVDGNGEFDALENKAYLFQTYVNMGGNKTGQIANMQNGNYNSTYQPSPESYTVVLGGRGDSKTVGTAVTFNFPQPVESTSGSPSTAVTAAVESTTSSDIWTCYSKVNGNPIVLPVVTPPGNYTISVGSSTYTFNNYRSSETVKVNSNDGIVYPVFNLVVNAAGNITTVNYKWKKLVNGTITDATTKDLAVAVEDTSTNTAFVHTSPFISFFADANTLFGSVLKFDRDGSSLDVSSSNIKLAEVHHIQASYNLTSRVVCKFDLY
ncbi:MAG: hypothetical protein WC645_07460 [Candidatus Margulisiibacteriota bacterium]